MRDQPDENGLQWLQRLDRNLIEPILIDMGLKESKASPRPAEANYVVQTPFDLNDPDIMDGVVAAIDSADIIIADLTDANANVYYEVSLAHALGKQVITVGDRPVFDLHGMRHIDLQQNTTLQSMNSTIRTQLIESLKLAHAEVTNYATPRNPITNFYGTSLPRASSTVAVAETYFINFVSPLVQSWTLTNYEKTEHLYPINRKALENGQDILISMGRSIEDRKGLRLHIVIPDKIEYATKDRINDLRGISKGTLQEFMISAPHRTFTINGRFINKTTFRFYDVPTPIEGLHKTVERRMKSLEIQRDSPAWRERELDEINLFAEALQRAIGNSTPNVRDNVKIVRFDSDMLTMRRDDVRREFPELVWVYDLLARR
jgi:hypothetical protein